LKLLGTLLAAAATLSAFEYGLQPQNVAEGIYCFFGASEPMNATNNGNMVNSCFADMGDAWLVIDSGPTYRYAEEAAAAIRAIAPHPFTHVVNTHVHDDHWFGNGYYAATGATVLGSGAFGQETPETPTRMQSRISKEAFEGTVPTLPDPSLETATTLRFAKGEARLLPLKRKAHTGGDVYVYLPEKNAVFAGDLVFNDRIPSLRDGDINGWIAALETITSLKPAVIVGGHGRRSDAEAAAFTLGYLKALREGVKAVMDGGGGIDDAVAAVTLEAYRTVPMYDAMHAANVNAVYRMLEWGDE